MILLSGSTFGQDWIDDSNFENKINEKSAFGDDEMSIVIVEFWAKFNDANAFQDWDKVEGITHYYRIDISKAPNAKKEYRIRTVSYTHLTLPTKA